MVLNTENKNAPVYSTLFYDFNVLSNFFGSFLDTHHEIKIYHTLHFDYDVDLYTL